MELKNAELIETLSGMVIAGGWRVGKGEGIGQSVETSCYDISSGDIIYSMVTIVYNAVLYIENCQQSRS